MDFYPLNQSPEQAENFKNNFWNQAKKISLVIGLSAIALTVKGDDIPELEVYNSPKSECPATDNTLTILDANIKYNPGYAARLVKKYNVDIATFQEVRREDFKKIAQSVGCSTIAFGLADQNVQTFSGGQGNATLAVNMKPGDLKEHKIYSGKFRSKKFIKDLFGIELSGPGYYYKEGRLATAVTYQTEVSGVKVPIRIVNTHTDGINAGPQQLESLSEFINQQTDKPTQINLVEGDLNRTIPQIKTMVLGLNKIWKIKEVGPTTASGRQIDQVWYQPRVIAESYQSKITSDKQVYAVVVESRTLDDKGSDHKAILSTVQLVPIYTLGQFFTLASNASDYKFASATNTLK